MGCEKLDKIELETTSLAFRRPPRTRELAATAQEVCQKQKKEPPHFLCMCNLLFSPCDKYRVPCCPGDENFPGHDLHTLRFCRRACGQRRQDASCFSGSLPNKVSNSSFHLLAAVISSGAHNQPRRRSSACPPSLGQFLTHAILGDWKCILGLRRANRQ